MNAVEYHSTVTRRSDDSTFVLHANAMSDSRVDDVGELARRLSDLESLLMFLQRTVEDLNTVILQQQRRLEAQDNELARRRATFVNLGDTMAEPPRKPEEEKPPHY